MLETSAFATQTRLPPPPPGWFDYHYAVLMDGRLALIRTSGDVHTAWRAWRTAVDEAVLARQPAPIEPDFWRDIGVRLSIFDGAAESGVVVVGSCRYPLVDRTADGRWLVVSSRRAAGQPNGRFYADDGTELGSIHLGEDVKNLLCSPDGTIWLGYSDMGGLNQSSWGGIIQIDERGVVVWSFNDNLNQVEMERDEYAWDCYALTLNGVIPWACYYSLFEIVKIEAAGVSFWPNAAGGARAIAVADDVVLLAGGYSEFLDRIAVVTLGSKTSRELGGFPFPPIARSGPGMVRGRNGVLHVVDGGIWYRMTPTAVADAAKAAGALEPIRQPSIDFHGRAWIDSPVGDW